MFAKCANSECAEVFDYQLGRVVRFHNHEHPEGEPPCVRHFWLCQNCSNTHLLEYRDGVGVVIRLRQGDSAGALVPRPVCECALSKRSPCCLG